jgi:hypothetical protein
VRYCPRDHSAGVTKCDGIFPYGYILPTLRKYGIYVGNMHNPSNHAEHELVIKKYFERLAEEKNRNDELVKTRQLVVENEEMRNTILELRRGIVDARKVDQVDVQNLKNSYNGLISDLNKHLSVIRDVCVSLSD